MRKTVKNVEIKHVIGKSKRGDRMNLVVFIDAEDNVRLGIEFLNPDKGEPKMGRTIKLFYTELATVIKLIKQAKALHDRPRHPTLLETMLGITVPTVEKRSSKRPVKTGTKSKKNIGKKTTKKNQEAYNA